jgi:hypothetical protein
MSFSSQQSIGWLSLKWLGSQVRCWLSSDFEIFCKPRRKNNQGSMLSSQFSAFFAEENWCFSQKMIKLLHNFALFWEKMPIFRRFFGRNYF